MVKEIMVGSNNDRVTFWSLTVSVFDTTFLSGCDQLMYYWVGVTEAVKTWIKNCSICQERTHVEPSTQPVQFCLAYGCEASSYIRPDLSFYRSEEVFERILWHDPVDLHLQIHTWVHLVCPAGFRRSQGSGVSGWVWLKGMKAHCASTPTSAPSTSMSLASHWEMRVRWLYHQTLCRPSCLWQWQTTRSRNRQTLIRIRAQSMDSLQMLSSRSAVFLKKESLAWARKNTSFLCAAPWCTWEKASLTAVYSFTIKCHCFLHIWANFWGSGLSE